MKVAIVFSDYRSGLPSGEREVVRNECEALERGGVDVHLLSASTDDGLLDPLYSLRAAGRVATGFGVSPLARIREIAPDVVHIHNLFPNFGHRWVAKLDCPIAVTLHNYRSICAQGSLFRDGSPCTLCPEGSNWQAIRHRCYRNSFPATLPLALALRRGLSNNPVLAHARLILVPSNFHRNLLVSYGLDASRTRTSPNFVPDLTQNDSLALNSKRAGWLFVGRLDAGKGILPLVQQWPKTEQLTVVGDGPLREEVCRAAGPSVRFLGAQQRTSVNHLLREAEGLIFPSRHFESQPLIYLEALRAGTPIVALDGNAVAQSVSSEGTGRVYRSGIEIPEALNQVRGKQEWLYLRCKETFEALYSENAWTARRLSEYVEVIEVGL